MESSNRNFKLFGCISERHFFRSHSSHCLSKLLLRVTLILPGIRLSFISAHHWNQIFCANLQTHKLKRTNKKSEKYPFYFISPPSPPPPKKKKKKLCSKLSSKLYYTSQNIHMLGPYLIFEINFCFCLLICYTPSEKKNMLRKQQKNRAREHLPGYQNIEPYGALHRWGFFEHFLSLLT